MKKIFSLVAMATMFLAGMTSCNNNDDELAQANTRSIGFDIHADGSIATRGYAINSTNVATTLANFQTWAYDDETDGLYMGASASAGKTVTNTNMDGTAWNYAPPQFWPVNALNFVAVAPAAPNGVTANATASADNVVTLTSTVSLSTNVEDQDDIMFLDKSPEYWAGWSLAFYQWFSGRDFMSILEIVPLTYPSPSSTPFPRSSSVESSMTREQSPRSLSLRSPLVA